MPTYRTPGVYVEEISTLPPSVAEVATAIPAFIGTTEKGKAGEVEVAEISTLLEYELRFGKPKPTEFQVAANGDVTLADPMPDRLMWYAIALYFKNGGGRCYVISVGNYATALGKDRFTKGLEALERYDEPTLIVMPEIVRLTQADFGDLCEQALAQCKKLGDRFAILDVREPGKETGKKASKKDEASKDEASKDEASKDEASKDEAGKDAPTDTIAANRASFGNDNLAYGAAYYPYLSTTLTHAYDEASLSVGTGTTKLNSYKTTNTALYNAVKKNLAEQRVVLPPSAAIAGIYARVDRERGVWKAPANVGVMSVLGPTRQITHDEQETLNIDATSGKSINAIRAFAGRGTLVWGARTLAGNDNEWRYVPVRRLFITIEESAKKATAFAVFEPNDATTWLKVKGMIESYLYGLWERGALQGAAPEAAYYVNVGLGKSMSPQDVLEGRMIVEIGIAAVRPAEFIVLRFSHKLAEA